MEKKDIIETWDALRRAFAMMALAMASNMPREKLFQKNADGEYTLKLNLPNSFRATLIPKAVATKLRERVARGDVTTIQPPEPFTWLVIKTGHEEMRAIHGIWVGRAASWRGKVDPATLPRSSNFMTAEEAIAKGIPVPTFKE